MLLSRFALVAVALASFASAAPVATTTETAENFAAAARRTPTLDDLATFAKTADDKETLTRLLLALERNNAPSHSPPRVQRRSNADLAWAQPYCGGWKAAGYCQYLAFKNTYCPSTCSGSTAPQICNGQPICQKTYGDVTFPATHNSHAVDCGGDAGTDYVDTCHYVNGLVKILSLGILDTYANHAQGLDKQWKAGFRAFLIDAYYSPYDGKTVKLCHGSSSADCHAGMVDAEKWFAHLAGLMRAAPNDVVTIVVETYVSNSAMKSALAKSGLGAFIDYAQGFKASGSSTWSIRNTKIADMVAPGGKRLVLLNQKGKKDTHDLTRTKYYQNGYDYTSQAEIKDASKCGSVTAASDGSGKAVYVMNQFMKIHAGTPSRDMSSFANDYKTVEKRIRMCWAKTKVRPSLITVDHFSEGGVVAAVTAVNKLNAPGDYTALPWGGWADGTLCGLGTTCHRCANEHSYWVGKLMTACGKEKKWKAGTRCLAGTTCESMCEDRLGYSWWTGAVGHHCGREPCWGAGKVCGAGTTCNSCCSGAEAPWYWFGIGKCR